MDIGTDTDSTTKVDMFVCPIDSLLVCRYQWMCRALARGSSLPNEDSRRPDPTDAVEAGSTVREIFNFLPVKMSRSNAQADQDTEFSNNDEDYCDSRTLEDEKKQERHAQAPHDTVGRLSPPSPDVKYSSFHEISSNIGLNSPDYDAYDQGEKHECRYYRIVYQGVVALLENPRIYTRRSGHYLSYGEIFSSMQQKYFQEESPKVSSHSPSPSPHQDENFVRVDRILTGGYAMDAVLSSSGNDGKGQASLFSPVPEERIESFGYILCSHKDEGCPVVELLHSEPQLEQGRFLYKIVSTTPVSIHVGPAIDAPKTPAFLLPSTLHEVSLRVLVDGIWFLRLSHRRGWIADTKCTLDGRQKNVTEVMEHDQANMSIVDDQQSVLSYLSSSSLGSKSRRRHKPPRRERHEPEKSLDTIKGSTHTPSISTDSAGQPNTNFLNVSILSDDLSFDRDPSSLPNSPDVSYTTNGTYKSNNFQAPANSTSEFFLMRVTAPNGLKILDAPQFQVNNLMRGRERVSCSHQVSQFDGSTSTTTKSIFHTMSGRIPVSNRPSNRSTVFDAGSRTRILPYGVLFEACRGLESTSSYTKGAGLIKLSDGSGWAIVPQRDELAHQLRHSKHAVSLSQTSAALAGFEEVGRAFLHGTNGIGSSTVWLRVVSRSGVTVVCPPPVAPTQSHEISVSPASSKSSSTLFPTSSKGVESDVASSVGSGFLDAMFRSPSKKKSETGGPDFPPRHKQTTKPSRHGLIPCGTCLEVESWDLEAEDTTISDDKVVPTYVRLCGGQGWVPLFLGERVMATPVHPPDLRFGSFWFRVQSSSGVKVRRGPSYKKAPSIKSEDGIYFIFECGEFLRASEVLTIFSEDGSPVESYAKLFRNRHVSLHDPSSPYRSYESLNTEAEWVCIYYEGELFLEECVEEPRIERLRQGWRYNVLQDKGVEVRRGPSFAADTTGIRLLGGESVLINERVAPAGENMQWLRIKDGDGWVHDTDLSGMPVMHAHSLRHRPTSKKSSSLKKEEVAYNTIIARLFHNESSGEGFRPSHSLKKS